MPITDFFKVRFPRSPAEGIVKGLCLGFLVCSFYDYLFTPTTHPFPSIKGALTRDQAIEIRDHSQIIVNLYELFVVSGAILGTVGSFIPHEPPRPYS